MENIKSSLGRAEDTAKKQRGRPFEPGTSGNPNGRPRGSRNKTTLAIEALFEGESEAITRKLLEMAKEGDMTQYGSVSNGCCRLDVIAWSRLIYRQSRVPPTPPVPRPRWWRRARRVT
jgi:hypothetical protein